MDNLGQRSPKDPVNKRRKFIIRVESMEGSLSRPGKESTDATSKGSSCYDLKSFTNPS